jgi:hypothetical protein
MRVMPKGEYCLFEIDGRGVATPAPAGFRPNTLLYAWGHAVAQSLGRGDRSYRISTIYLEFENNAGVIAAPAFDPEDGIDYYNALASNPARDYLRVPIESTPAIDVGVGFEAFLPPDRGNRVIFSAQTGNRLGVHGKQFSEAVSSKVFGVALAATPVLNDATADIVVARGYYAPADQIPKTARQLGIVYRITF